MGVADEAFSAARARSAAAGASAEEPGAARRALRRATQAVHERLHRHPGLARFAAGTIRKDEYARLLARSYGFYAMAEPLAGLSGAKTASLARDLAELGVEARLLPICRPVPMVTGRAERIGLRYVLIGASLGGKLMARANGARSGAEALPMRFLTSLAAEDWQSFAAGLDAGLPDPLARSRAARAACAAFTSYEEWMAWNE